MSLSVSVSVNKPLVVPNIKPGADARNVHAVSGLYHFVVPVMLDVVRRVDVVAMIHEMYAIQNHSYYVSQDGLNDL